MGAEKKPAGAPGRWQPRCAGGCHCQSGPEPGPGAASQCGQSLRQCWGAARASPSLRLGPAPARFFRFKVQTQTALGRWVPPQVKNQNRRGGACRGQCDWQPLPARTGRSSHCGGRPRDSAARAASDRRRTPSEPRSGSESVCASAQSRCGCQCGPVAISTRTDYMHCAVPA
jgi:hypothetical protein